MEFGIQEKWNRGSDPQFSYRTGKNGVPASVMGRVGSVRQGEANLVGS